MKPAFSQGFSIFLVHLDAFNPRGFQELLGEGASGGGAALPRRVLGAGLSPRRETRHRLFGDLPADGYPE